MRWSVLISLCLIPLLNAVPVSAAEPAPLTVEAVLKALEARMKTVESFQANCMRTDVHPLTKKTTTFTGIVAWQKPNLAKIDLTPLDEVGKKDADKTQFERFISNGKKVYEYSPRDKLIIVHDLPRNAADDNVLFSMLKGMTAADLKKRFDVKVQPDTLGWYAHVYLTPKNAADQQEFKTAIVSVFMKNPNENKSSQPDLTHLPCQIKLFQPNGREVSYLFGDLRPNARLEASVFAPSSIPGYQLKLANAPASPKAP